MLKQHVLLLNEATGNENGGGQSESQTSPNPTTTQGEGRSDNDVLNEMYKSDETVETKEQSSQEGIQNQEAKPGESGYVEPVGDDSGYKPPGEIKDETKVDPPAVDDKTVEADKVYEGLEKETADAVKDFATKNKLTPEATKEVAEFLKAQGNAVEKYKASEGERIQQARADQKKEWYNNLKVDKEFGGENFDKNIKKAEKVINTHLTGFKNILTTSKGMVPPDIMKDLAKVHDALFGTEPMVSGGVDRGASTDPIEQLNNFYK